MSTSARWTVFTLLGIAAWLGATVYVAATNNDPSDAAPILRTFALGGAVFFGLILLAAGLEVRRTGRNRTERLYHRLALRPVPGHVIRAAARRGQGVRYLVLVFVGATSALLFTAIALGESGPYRILFAGLFVLVLAWAAFSLVALGRAYRTGDEIVAPLGLRIVAVPGVVVGGQGADLAGRLALGGRRHGRDVTISQRTTGATTTIQGMFPPYAVTSPAAMATLTGEPAKHWRDVEARAGADGVVVRRRGNGAGRWFLHDLLLAETIAARP
jgi:hypothetical protein